MGTERSQASLALNGIARGVLKCNDNADCCGTTKNVSKTASLHSVA
jgi:hypothetical protein